LFAENWAIVLWIHAVCLIVTNLFFCIFCSADAASWTLDSWSGNADKKSRVTVIKRNQVAPASMEEGANHH
jgi:hypothetical protein